MYAMTLQLFFLLTYVHAGASKPVTERVHKRYCDLLPWCTDGNGPSQSVSLSFTLHCLHSSTAAFGRQSVNYLFNVSLPLIIPFQIFLPRFMCIGLLHSASRYCSSHLMLRSQTLCSRARRTYCLGLVYLGYVSLLQKR